jgi:hypothetical protein
MAMVCPECGKTYEQRLHCQLCGVRLVFHDVRRRFRLALPSGRWRQSAWGRVAIGLFLAQGLLYALRQLLAGLLLGLQGPGDPQETWATPAGLVLLEGLRLATLLVGAVFAAGGHRQGLLLGSVVGAANAALTLLLQPGPAHAVSALEMYGQPLLQGAAGALGGWLGCLVWKPLPVHERVAEPPKRQRARHRRRLSLGGRIAWLRVAVGTGIAVAGSLSAAALFDWAIDASAGRLGTTDEMQDRFIAWEIKALALLLGGTFAGATTFNGLKQGLAVGAASGAILLGIETGRHPQGVQVAALTLVSTLTLSLAGGWFGGQLFPPVVKLRRKGRLDPAV